MVLEKTLEKTISKLEQLKVDSAHLRNPLRTVGIQFALLVVVVLT